MVVDHVAAVSDTIEKDWASSTKCGRDGHQSEPFAQAEDEGEAEETTANRPNGSRRIIAMPEAEDGAEDYCCGPVAKVWAAWMW